jgi:hypothetical protein
MDDTMTNDQTPPDWVLTEAAKRAALHLTPAQYRAGFIAKAARPYFLALCDMILRHEQPPVDRKLLCAREAVKEWDFQQVIVVNDLALRAIELWEEGFGK